MHDDNILDEVIRQAAAPAVTPPPGPLDHLSPEAREAVLAYAEKLEFNDDDDGYYHSPWQYMSPVAQAPYIKMALQKVAEGDYDKSNEALKQAQREVTGEPLPPENPEDPWDAWPLNEP